MKKILFRVIPFWGLLTFCFFSCSFAQHYPDKFFVCSLNELWDFQNEDSVQIRLIKYNPNGLYSNSIYHADPCDLAFPDYNGFPVLLTGLYQGANPEISCFYKTVQPNDTTLYVDPIPSTRTDDPNRPLFSHVVLNGNIALPLINSKGYLLISIQGAYLWDVSIPRKLYAHQIGIEKNRVASILSVNKLLYADSTNQSLISSLGAVRHANGQDWWLIAKENFNDVWLLFLYDSLGIRLHHKVRAGMQLKDLHFQHYINSESIIIFSRDGSKVALTNAEGLTQIFDFDRCNGGLQLIKIVPKHKTVVFLQYANIFGSLSQFTENGNSLLLSSACVQKSLTCNNKIYFSRLDGSGFYAQPKLLYETSNYDLFGKVALNPHNPKKIYVFSKGLKRLGETTEIQLDETGDSVKYIGKTTLKFSHDGENPARDYYGTRSPAIYPNYRLGAQPLKKATRAGRWGDTLYLCGTDTIGLGVMPKKYVKYEWFPSDGLSSDTIANPTFYPERTGKKDSLFQFVLTAKGLPYSCWDGETMTDTVWVKIIPRNQSPCTYTSSEVLPLSEKVNLIDVYPNPAYDFITLRSNTETLITIVLSDITGKTLLSKTLENQGEHTFDTSNLSSGVYVIKAYSKDNSFTEKFVIVR